MKAAAEAQRAQREPNAGFRADRARDIDTHAQRPRNEANVDATNHLVRTKDSFILKRTCALVLANHAPHMVHANRRRMVARYGRGREAVSEGLGAIVERAQLATDVTPS